MIIASCIPTLQPLLELVLGKRTLGSYSNGQSGPYKNSGSNWNTASFDRSKKSAAGKDDLVVTNVDSQESILPADGNKDQFQRNGNKTFPMGAIQRTDDVTVEYESHSTHGANSQNSW